MNIQYYKIGIMNFLLLFYFLSGYYAIAADDITPSVPPPKPIEYTGLTIKSVDELPAGIQHNAKALVREIKSKGYTQVSNESLDNHFARYHKYYRKLKSDTQKNATAINQMAKNYGFEHSLVMVPKSDSNNTIVRIFNGPRQAKAAVVEATGGMLMTKELINTSVNGQPAIMRLSKSGNGGLKKELVWVNNGKRFNVLVIVPGESADNINIQEFDAFIYAVAESVDA